MGILITHMFIPIFMNFHEFNTYQNHQRPISLPNDSDFECSVRNVWLAVGASKGDEMEGKTINLDATKSPWISFIMVSVLSLTCHAEDRYIRMFYLKSLGILFFGAQIYRRSGLREHISYMKI